MGVIEGFMKNMAESRAYRGGRRKEVRMRIVDFRRALWRRHRAVMTGLHETDEPLIADQLTSQIYEAGLHKQKLAITEAFRRHEARYLPEMAK